MNQSNGSKSVLGLLAALFAGNADAQRPDCMPARDDTARRQAEQKIVLLARLVGDTEPVRRVEASGNADAQQAIGDAREQVELANAALEAGCDSDAVDMADDGLRFASTAFQLVRGRGDADSQAYGRVYERTVSYVDVLESQPEDIRGIDAADLAGMHRQIAQAESVAIDGDFAEATRLLRPVADRLERRLAAIYDQRTVVYEKDFAGPQEEYDYIAGQYRGYRLLLDQMGSERQPPHSAAERYAAALSDAESGARRAEAHAEDGDWEAALEEMRQAVGQCERAMRLLGLGY